MKRTPKWCGLYESCGNIYQDTSSESSEGCKYCKFKLKQVI